MADEKTIDRIRKLLKLSESQDVNEAANAAAAAQRLMERHNIRAAMIAVEDATDRFKITQHDDSPLARGKRIAAWRVRLAQSISAVNGCEVFFNDDDSGARDVCLVGSTSDAENVAKLFAYLVHEIDRLATAYGRPKGRKQSRKRNHAALGSFREGAVDTIHWRLLDAQDNAREAARREAQKNCTALATLDKAIAVLDRRAEQARDYYENILCPEELEDVSVDREREWLAYAAGTKAAGSLDLGVQVERKEIGNS